MTFPKAAAKKVATKTTAPVAKKAAPARKPAAKAAVKPLTADQKKKLKAFKAPADLKSSFVVVKIKAAKDGIVDAVNAQLVQGRLDNERSLKVDLAKYDLATYTRLVARVATPYWAANPQKRLPANSLARITLRVGKRATGDLTARIVEIATTNKNETTGKLVTKAITDKKNPTYRQYRKIAATLSGFAVGLQPLTKQIVNELNAGEEQEVAAKPARVAKAAPAAKKPVAKAATGKKAVSKVAAKKPVRR